MATGSAQTRARLFSELKDDIILMAKSKYAHFFIAKILKYGNSVQKQHIFKQLSGNVVPLMKHKVSIRFLLFINPFGVNDI